MADQHSCFSERYREIVESVSGVADSPAHYRGVVIRERVVRCVWYGQFMASDSLRTVDGEAVRVFTPGWWNVEGGPDFLKAELVFGDEELVRGDVEIHLYASGWYHHRHDGDPNYNNVLLHVVLWNDREDDFVVNQAGQPVRQLVIEDNLERELGELLDSIPHEDFPQPPSASAGLCHSYLSEGRVGEQWVGDFLDHAGDERILAKAQVFTNRAQFKGEDQVFYESLMGALGYKKNKRQFEELARRAPLSTVAQVIESGPGAVQACLFNAAGLVPVAQYLPGLPDPETYELVEAYREDAQDPEKRPVEGPMSRQEWDFSGTRPANSPIRRVAAAAGFLVENLRNGLCESVLQCVPRELSAKTGFLDAGDVRKLRKVFHQFFSGHEDPYWSYRCSFGGKQSPRPMRLIGEERVDIILANVILPALLSRARRDGDAALESLLHQVYDLLPPLAGTHVTRFMVSRVFGEAAPAERIVNSARRQQGLYQLYTDFERDDRNCDDCAFARAMSIG